MSDYIEDRITELEEKHEALEDGVKNIYARLCLAEENVEILKKGVEDLKEQMNILADDYKIFRSEDYTDQSTEEFVKVVRCKNCKHKGQPSCPMTFWVSGYAGYNVRLIDPTDDDGYCYKGEPK